MTKGTPFRHVRATLCFALVLIPLFGVLAQMDWSGGEADWASENWQDAVGDPVSGWPGDPDNISVRANLAAPGKLFIRDGDHLEPGINWMYAGGPTIEQSGGTYYSQSTIYVFDSEWKLTGGLLGGPGGIRLYAGGVFNLYDGKLGDRDENTAHNFSIGFHGGTAILNIHGGTLRPHAINMDQGATDGRIRIYGADSDIMTVVGCTLASSQAGRTATVEFIFSAAGISTWVNSGGSAIRLNLGSGDTAARLEVEVTEFLSGGTTPFALFDFGVNRLEGAFGSVTVYDDTLGFLSAGTPGDLELGEYALVYADDTEGKILLYYHNNPEADQKHVYVSPDGGHVFPHATWATASTNVNDAVNHANSLVGATVWISNGTYVVTSEITIFGTQVRGYGGDRTAVIIDGGNAVRPFFLGAADAVLADLTVANGYAGTGDRNADGGGVYLNAEGALLENCVITGCEAGRNGGGVYQLKGTVRDCLIVDNDGISGGIYVATGQILYDSTVATNRGTTVGGIYMMRAEVRNCVVVGNTGTGAGGVFAWYGKLIENSRIVGNTASTPGSVIATGGIRVSRLNPFDMVIRNCLVANNHGDAPDYRPAGGIGIDKGSGSLEGLVCIIESSTIVSNRATGTSIGAGGVYSHTDDLYTTNSIVYHNIRDGAAGRNDFYSTQSGAHTQVWHSCIGVPPSTMPLKSHGNITDAPLLVDYLAGDYRLQSESPVINAGVNLDWMIAAFDLDGNPRIDKNHGGIVDMGAFEYTPPPPPGTTIILR